MKHFDTDIAYCAHPPEAMKELSSALTLHLDEVTCAALTAERTLYHSCLSAISTKLFFENLNEKERGAQIADLADRLFRDAMPLFNASLVLKGAEMGKVTKRIREYVHNIAHSVSEGTLNHAVYHKMWGLDNYSESWQRRAVETYEVIKNRVDSGAYHLPEGQTIESLTALWCEINYRYKTYRHMAREHVNKLLDEKMPDHPRLEYVPSIDRKMVIFTGGMGSGKSTLTRLWLEKLPAADFQRLFIHDADYLKLALARSAMAEQKLSEYTGPEVHNESTSVLREVGRKINFLAKDGKDIPHVVMNTVHVNDRRLTEALAGGGHVEVHHVSIAPEEAIASAHERALTLGRMPSEEDIRKSCAVSAQNIIDLSGYGGANLCTYLYERSGNKIACVGVMDMRLKQAFIYQREGFERVIGRAEAHGDHRQEIARLLNHGITLNLMNPENSKEVLAAITPERKLYKNHNSTAELSPSDLAALHGYPGAASAVSKVTSKREYDPLHPAARGNP